jgi:hypothetical protein
MSSENSGLEEKRLISMFQKLKIESKKCELSHLSKRFLNAVKLDIIRQEVVCG